MGFLKSISGLYKCLYCIWPALVIGLGWWFSRSVAIKPKYFSLTPGVDLASPQAMAEFDASRQRNAERRWIIYICAGVIALGYLAALLSNTFTLGVKASPNPTALRIAVTASLSPTYAETGTFTPAIAASATMSSTPTRGTPTYQPTATNRVIYVSGPQVTILVTVLVTRIVTAKPTRTPTPTQTMTPTWTATSTWTAVQTETFTPCETVPVQ
jgi:hypothetical protein